MSEEKATSFVKRCYDFFGKLPGQTLQEFNAELKELTPGDRMELYELFNAGGMPTEAPGN